MKTLLLQLFVIPFLVVSCSKNTEQETFLNKKEIAFNKKESSKENNQPNEKNTYFEEDIHAFYISNMLTLAYQQKEELLLQIEEGNEELIDELEKLQEKIKFNEKLKKLLFGIRPVFPTFPPPPDPCPRKIDDMSCRLPLNDIAYILLSRKAEAFSMQIKTEEGEIIGENGELFLVENFDDLPATEIIKENYKGNVTLRITKFFAPLEQEITYEVNAHIGK